jgi:hypothetical protein
MGAGRIAKVLQDVIDTIKMVLNVCEGTEKSFKVL